MRKARWMTALALVAALAPGAPALAVEGDVANGKRLFMAKGSEGKACMTCHPKGLTTGKRFRGKKIPDLTQEQFSDRKLASKSKKFLELQGLELTDAELTDLMAFVRTVQTDGFGPVPPEWQGYVKEKLGE